MALISPAVSDLLERLIATLDVPEELADAAIFEFERVAQWLGEPDSPLSAVNPHLYPQGSFKLGTPIRPLAGGDDFDIDLVCRLEIDKDRVTQKDLKTLVGDRLRADADLRLRLTERRRCWTLGYEPRFHLDVLPAIPDPAAAGEPILLTDRELTRWQFSNPLGYAEWFFSRMRPMLNEARATVAKTANVNIDDVPEWRVRVPLQRAVQLLKRHRDVRFRDDPERRPVSIIITTLAGRAYRHQPDLAATAVDLAERMPDFIETRDRKWWVANPAHLPENFADKWNEDPTLRDAFLQWLDVLRTDIAGMADAGTTADARFMAEQRLGVQGRPVAPAAAVVSVPDVEDVSHAIALLWPQRLRCSCTVSGAVYSKVRGGKRLYPLHNVVLKGSGIQFRAVTDAPEPFEVRWQVTNTGAEARAAGGLRGKTFEHGEGRNGVTKWERAEYAGTHFIEAFVITDGTVIARSGRVSVRIPAPVKAGRFRPPR